MTRPADWSPLWSGDPIPGYPDGVSGAADTYGRTAGNIAKAAAALLSISDGVGMCSEAVAEFQAKALKVRTDILKTQSRYAAASSVLSGYASHLRQAQADSLRLRAAAQLTQHDHDLAQYRMQHAHDQAAQATDPLTKTQALTAVNHQKAVRDQASHDISAYSSQLAAVVAGRQAAARVAIQGLDDADTTSAVRGDTYMDKLKHEAQDLVAAVEQVIDTVGDIAANIGKWIIDHADTISNILDWISTALTVLAIIAIFVFPAAAPVLFTLAKITQGMSYAVSLGSKVYLAATGQIPWRNVGEAVVALGVTYATGKLLGKAGDAISKKTLNLVTAKATASLAAKNAASGVTKAAKRQVIGGLGTPIRGIPTAIKKVKPKILRHMLTTALKDNKTDLELGYILRKGPAHLGYSVGTRIVAGVGVVSRHVVEDVIPEVLERTGVERKMDNAVVHGIDELRHIGDHAQRRIVCPLPLTVRIPAGALA